MSSATITFNNELSAGDPLETPVLIIGQVKHLAQLQFQDVKCKLEQRVTEEVNNAYICLHARCAICED